MQKRQRRIPATINFRLFSPFCGKRIRRGQAVDLFVIPEHRLAEYLAGRPRDPRVTYCTHINRSKFYTGHTSKRLRRARAVAAAA